MCGLTDSDFERGVSPLVRGVLLSLLMLDLGDVESSVACGVMSERKATTNMQCLLYKCSW